VKYILREKQQEAEEAADGRICKEGLVQAFSGARGAGRERLMTSS
jgi:hypothetical protein